MASKKEIAIREEELVEFLKQGFAEYAKAEVKKTSGLCSGTTYLDITSRVDGSQGIVLPWVAHVPEGGAKITQLTTAAVRQRNLSPLWVLYKDGEEFFRFSGTQDRSGFRKKYGRSLRHEDVGERSKIMLLSDEEKALTTDSHFGANKVGYGDITYYRPLTDNRGQGLSTYRFIGPVEFVRDPNSRYAHFTPVTRQSTMRFKWDKYENISTPFTLKKGKLASMADTPASCTD